MAIQSRRSRARGFAAVVAAAIVVVLWLAQREPASDAAVRAAAPPLAAAASEEIVAPPLVAPEPEPASRVASTPFSESRDRSKVGVTVVNDAEEPIAKAYVAMLKREAPKTTRNPADFLALGVADEHGRFELPVPEALRSASQVVVGATADLYGQTVVEAEPGAEVVLKLEDAEVRTLEIVVDAGGDVTPRELHVIVATTGAFPAIGGSPVVHYEPRVENGVARIVGVEVPVADAIVAAEGYRYAFLGKMPLEGSTPRRPVRRVARLLRGGAVTGTITVGARGRIQRR